MVSDVLNNKDRCCGCTACANICPQQCIQMSPDEEGFLYPQINEYRCVGCNLCDKVCPVKTPFDIPSRKVSTVVVRSKDSDNLRKSTSGGVFKSLAEYVLKQNGVVCAAAYEENLKVKHLLITEDEYDDRVLSRIRGSKYVQSNIGDCYFRIKQYLKLGRQVLFVGTPCQVSGLKKYLLTEYDNLLTVDLVCHGTPSPKLWEKYVAFYENKMKSKITAATFRSKKYGYHSGGFMELHFENKKIYRCSGRVDYMLKSFFEEICSRPICYDCPFKGINRVSDLTLYDCWHFSNLISGISDDDLGYTNVVIQSVKGKKYIDLLSNTLEIYNVDTELAKKLDGPMIDNCPKPHPMRNEFYKEIDEVSLPEHINKYIPITRKDYYIEWIKKILYSVGVLQRTKSKR